MKKENKIIYWLPRILSIAFVLFLSIFSFDVFNEYSGWESIPALLIHLLPAIVLAGFIIIAWKKELVGAVVFIGTAILYVILVGFDRPWSWYLSISGQATIIGFLYALSARYKKKLSFKKAPLN